MRIASHGRVQNFSRILNAWLCETVHRVRWCFGKATMQTFLDASMTKQKMVAF